MTTPQFLDAQGLQGARIGIPRAFFYEPAQPPGGGKPRGGLNADERRTMDAAVAVLRQHGSTIVDPANIPGVVEPDRHNSFLTWQRCDATKPVTGARCSIVLNYALKRDFNAWLASLGPTAPVKTLNELRRWNTAHRQDRSDQIWTGGPRRSRRDSTKCRPWQLRD